MKLIRAKITMIGGFGWMLAGPLLTAYSVIPREVSVAAMLVGFLFGMMGMIEWAFP